MVHTGHPCNDCPARADHGVIACPVAAAVLNKGRCRRIRAQDSGQAYGQLARARLQRFEVARAAGDKPVMRFLRWHHRKGGLPLSRVLAGLEPAEQIQTVADPVIVRPHRRANGDGGTGAAAIILALCKDDPSRGDGHGDAGRPSGPSDDPMDDHRNGERLPPAACADPIAAETEDGLAGEAQTGRVSKRVPATDPHQNRARGCPAADAACNAP